MFKTNWTINYKYGNKRQDRFLKMYSLIGFWEHVGFWYNKKGEFIGYETLVLTGPLAGLFTKIYIKWFQVYENQLKAEA